VSGTKLRHFTQKRFLKLFLTVTLFLTDAKNFLVNMDGAAVKYAFITYRCVEAPDPGAAECIAHAAHPVGRGSLT
jgi:hypothetical protein